MGFCYRCEAEVEVFTEHREGLLGPAMVTYCVLCGAGLSGVFDSPLYNDQGKIEISGWCSTIDLPASRQSAKSKLSLWQRLMKAVRHA